MAIDNALKNPVVTAVLAVKEGEDFVALGGKNPLPSAQQNGVSSLQNIIREQNVFIAHGVNVPAMAGNLSKIQLWNPADSGKLLVCYIASMWHTSGSVTYKVSYTDSVLSSDESPIAKQNLCYGSTNTASTKIYTKNSDSTIASRVFSQVSVSSIAPNGTTLLSLSQAVCVPNKGILIESTVANMAINGLFTWVEIDLADLPNIS